MKQLFLFATITILIFSCQKEKDTIKTIFINEVDSLTCHYIKCSEIEKDKAKALNSFNEAKSNLKKTAK